VVVAAVDLWQMAAAGDPAAWTVGPPLFLPGPPGMARAAFFLNAVDPLYVNAV
jgi:hypothetical protein